MKLNIAFYITCRIKIIKKLAILAFQDIWNKSNYIISFYYYIYFIKIKLEGEKI